MKTRKKPLVHFDLFGEPIEDEASHPKTAILPLDFESNPVRVVMVKGEPWFVLSDLARVLGYGHTPHAARILRENQKGVHKTDTLGGEQELIIVNESGLYRLVMRSNKPEAERFQDWVTDDVLPTIRKTGTYSLGSRDRVGVMAKKLRCDRGTAKTRCEAVDTNKANNARLASEGTPRRGFANLHNAAYRGQFGREAPELRKSLGLKPTQTPLNRMGIIPLSTHNHTKILLQKIVEESLKPIPNEEQCRLAETIAAEMTAADFQRLGPGWGFGVVEDGARGRIIDVAKRLPSGQMMELAPAI